MTHSGGKLSEKGKVYAFCILFPIFWPFIPVLLICDLVEWIRDKCSNLYWRWYYRKEQAGEEGGREMSEVLSGCAVRAAIQQERQKLSVEDTHYLGAIKIRLETLYDLTEAPNIREQLSDEVDWVEEKLKSSTLPTSPAPAGEWQTIASAKDYPAVCLVWDPYFGMKCARFDFLRKVWITDGPYDWEVGGKEIDLKPTHWRPLPTPPASTQTDQKKEPPSRET